jgi:hypothetical protein
LMDSEGNVWSGMAGEIEEHSDDTWIM